MAMELLVLAFFVSLVTTLVLIRYQRLHERVSSDHDLSGPQKFHTHAVPRIGGIGIFLALVISAWVAHSILSLERGLLLLQICMCALPAFAVGLIEDLTKRIGVKTRLVAIATSAYMGIYSSNVLITKIDVTGVDWGFKFRRHSNYFYSDCCHRTGQCLQHH